MSTIVSKDAFESADNDTRMLLIYDMLDKQNELLAIHIENQTISCKIKAEECDKRFKKIQSRKKFDSAISAAGGFLGGIVAVFLKFTIWTR